jgi:methanogenic corrinoid protein MtbC1
MASDAPSDPQAVVAQLLAAVGDYDVAACDAGLAAAAGTMAPLSLVRDVAGPLLREAGNRWHRNEYSIVQEHMVSGVVRRQLSYALDRLSVGATGPRILFTTLAGERHEMGSLMTAVVAASRGCRCVYLGPDLPVPEVARFCHHQPVQVVALSLVTQPEVNDACAQLRQLRAALPGHVQVWIGGQAAVLLQASDLAAGITQIRGLDGFLESLAALGQRQE